ncbi:hypothetical protein MBRA_54870 (plasmid) [Mycobacterium branderi]|uniref:Uncharacterized protein n=1 Tax=Mycobacterium branderi TaxID=43348 RepID=A0ABM7KVY4_9MYCO|nr:hypothetical protein MBRA_54870 [Mycobacterium branderi]
MDNVGLIDVTAGDIDFMSQVVFPSGQWACSRPFFLPSGTGDLGRQRPRQRKVRARSFPSYPAGERLGENFASPWARSGAKAAALRAADRRPQSVGQKANRYGAPVRRTGPMLLGHANGVLKGNRNRTVRCVARGAIPSSNAQVSGSFVFTVST